MDVAKLVLFKLANYCDFYFLMCQYVKLKQGGSLDLFVVNSFGSAFQALFICLLLPFLSRLWGIPFSQLPNYLKDGAACFLNVGTLSSGKLSFLNCHLLYLEVIKCLSSLVSNSSRIVFDIDLPSSHKAV